MNDELDFESAVRERVGLLKDLPEEFVQKTLEATQFSPGALKLIKNLKNHGVFCVLVSGGFTCFTGPIGQKAGFNMNHGNILEMENGALTGKVQEPILNKYAKVEYLDKYVQELTITIQDTITGGDGANDLPMLQKAGMGVGYKPKPVVAREIDNVIIHGDLSALLYAQGYLDQDIT